jgi:hypothetical protein
MTDPAGRGPGGALGSEPGGGTPESGRSRYARPLPRPPGAAPAPGADLPGAPTPSGRDPSATATNRRRAFVTVARIAGPPVALAAFATVVLVAVAVLLAGSRSIAVNAWLLTVGGLVAWTFWRALARALPTAASSAFDTVRDRPVEPPSKLYDVIAIEGALLDAEWSRGGVEHRLRPLLRKIASARLIEHHQVDLDTEPAEARRILGEELWALIERDGDPRVGPDADPTRGHSGAGMAPGAGPAPARERATAATSPAPGQRPAHAHLAELAGVAGPADTLRSSADTPLPAEWTRTHHGRRGMPRAEIRRAIDLLEAL